MWLFCISLGYLSYLTNYFYSTVLEQANQWLKGNPGFKVMKFESFNKKLADKDGADLDQVIYHESSYGVNKYVRGLRYDFTENIL